jgi:hypothetical protein
VNEIDEFEWVKDFNKPTIENLTKIYEFLDYWKRPFVWEEFAYWLQPDSEEITRSFIYDLIKPLERTEKTRKFSQETKTESSTAIPTEIFAFLQESRMELLNSQYRLSVIALRLRQIQTWSRTNRNSEND